MRIILKLSLFLAAWAPAMSSVAAVDGEPVSAIQGGAELALAGDEKPANAEALVKLAAKYEHAEGVPRDYAAALAFYCQAAKLGSADAQYALGWMYANGRGIPRDDGVAGQLFGMAAEQGHPQAQNMMRYIRSSVGAVLPSCLHPQEEIVHVEAVTEAKESQAQTAAKSAEEEPGPAVYLKSHISDLVYQLAPDYDVDPKLALAVISVESGFNVHAQSPKNAQGLMQLIPETAQRFSVKNAFDPKENIKGGLAYLQWLLAFFKGSVPLVLAAYNAGEKAVAKYRGIPPYPETQDYVRKIAKLYKKAKHPYRRDLVDSVLQVTQGNAK